jgi:branched-chain amino acid aminotransferase
MNIMFVIGDELVTPPLDAGTILRGVTRDTVLELASEFGLKISERPITIEDVFESHKRGELKEIFGTGTAAVISPVGHLHYNGETIIINNMEIGPIAQRFYDTITGIQYGEIKDNHDWIVKVNV